MEKYVYVDFNSCKSKQELKQFIDNKIFRLTKILGYKYKESIEIIFDDELKECILDVQDFYFLKSEYLRNYEI